MALRRNVYSELCIVNSNSNHSQSTTHNSRSSLGYNLLELILAMAVGAVIIAGTYTASVIIAKQHERISAFTQVQEVGIPSLHIISRDLRMAGYTALVEATMESTFGTITTPTTITDGFYNSTDKIEIIYDRDTTTRKKYTYYVAANASATEPTRQGLYLKTQTWDSATSAWLPALPTADLVANYIEDLQFVGSDTDSNGNPRFVDVFMLFRSKSMVPADVTYTKPAQTYGNYNYSFTDRYHRDEFSATINIKNLR